MSAFASGSGSASAPDADAVADANVDECWKRVMAEFEDFPDWQKDSIAGPNYLGGAPEEEEVEDVVVVEQEEEVEDVVVVEQEEEEVEVFSTPLLTQQHPQMQGQSQRGQAGEGEGEGEGEHGVTQIQPSLPSPASSDSSWERFAASKTRKPRVCTRKVRCGAKFRDPAPALASTLSPALAPPPPPPPAPASAPASAPPPAPSSELDPLVRIMLMIPPADPPAATGSENMDILELALRRGLFAREQREFDIFF